MDLLEVLAKWLFWLFDGIGVNFILKKIAKAFDKKNEDSPNSNSNSLISPKIPQL
ncbi:hypothetical protein [Spirosoma oryzicola]|uniref:hypothetical protein n=1 Tax=Spirosoma oryzicola TaxID=2898794 RepID=UPI001E3105ED|nr:hypothetical protein [Spirosoma oryzicola]UHG94767.1 hypothetical protein LQ777_28920 [Spirosoma oryzicola]